MSTRRTNFWGCPGREQGSGPRKKLYLSAQVKSREVFLYCVFNFFGFCRLITICCLPMGHSVRDFCAIFSNLQRNKKSLSLTPLGSFLSVVSLRACQLPDIYQTVSNIVWQIRYKLLYLMWF